MSGTGKPRRPARSSAKPVTAVVVGAGQRAVLYGSYALEHPRQLKIVGVVDPDPLHRRQLAEAHGFSQENCFETVRQLEKRGRIADAVINGTMDRHHAATAIPLLKAGYHMLLEKPIATTRADMLRIRDAARQSGSTVMICHVLRYAPFYAAIRKRVADGQIGEIISIRTVENVGYHHMATGWVRGKWSRTAGGESSMLMCRSCHDLDLIVWLKTGVSPQRVASFGSRMFFREEQAPKGSGKRCLVDCKIERSCPYSAKKLYVDAGLLGFYAFRSIEHLGPEPTRRQKLTSLRENNPYGRCVWRCDNDVTDHQTVIVEFADGCTASHNVTGGAARGCRTIHLVGAKGEIQGVMESGKFVIRRPSPRKKDLFDEREVSVSVSGQLHGGGNMLLVADFVRVLRGKAPSLSTTSLSDSIHGHLIGFAADESRVRERFVKI